MLFLISWQFDSIPNIEIEYRLESNRIDFKIIEINLSFWSISRVEIVGSSRFLKLKSKSNSTINLNIIL